MHDGGRPARFFMIKHEFETMDIKWAYQRAAAVGELKNSITKNRHTPAGMLGELMFCRSFTDANWVGNYDYDFMSRGKRVEIKTQVTSCKNISESAMKNRTFNISNFNPNQKCDYYVFAMVHVTLEFGWLCGFVAKSEFKSVAVFRKKGENEPTRTEFIYHCNTWTIKGGQLNGITIGHTRNSIVAQSGVDVNR